MKKSKEYEKKINFGIKRELASRNVGWLNKAIKRLKLLLKRSGVGDGRSKAPRAFFMKNLLYHRNLKNVKIFNKLNPKNIKKNNKV